MLGRNMHRHLNYTHFQFISNNTDWHYTDVIGLIESWISQIAGRGWGGSVKKLETGEAQQRDIQEEVLEEEVGARENSLGGREG